MNLLDYLENKWTVAGLSVIQPNKTNYGKILFFDDKVAKVRIRKFRDKTFEKHDHILIVPFETKTRKNPEPNDYVKFKLNEKQNGIIITEILPKQ